MKLNKYFIGLGVISSMFFASCSTDVEGPVYTSPTENVSFETEKADPVKTSADSYTMNVRVIRANSKGAYTMKYTSSASAAGIFSDDANGEVTFADGQSVATIKVTAANLEKGFTYTDTLRLSDADVATADTITNSANAYTVLTVVSDYTWVSAGTCKFVDGFWGAGDGSEFAENVKIIQAKENPTLYRIVNPWQAIFDDVTNETFIEFTLNSDNTISFEEGTNGNVNGYYIYWDTQDYADYCYVEQEGNDFVVNSLYLYGGSKLYMGAFEFIWDGWPGAN